MDYSTLGTNLGDTLPLDDESYADLVRQAITDCNGMIYAGGDLEAQLRLLRWLRAHPSEAGQMLSFQLEESAVRS